MDVAVGIGSGEEAAGGALVQADGCTARWMIRGSLGDCT